MTDVHAGASSMKVAVGQFAAGSDKRANLERISTLSEEAARTGARLVVFPEGAMHTFGELTDDLSPAAESLDGRFVSELSKIVPIALGVAPFCSKKNTPLDRLPFAGVRTVEGRLARLRKGLKGRADVRPTSARWAWVEYMLSQGGEAAGLSAMDAWRAGGSFAAWRRSFRERGATPFRARPVPDGRRNAPSLTALQPAETN